MQLILTDLNEACNGGTNDENFADGTAVSDDRIVVRPIITGHINQGFTSEENDVDDQDIIAGSRYDNLKDNLQVVVSSGEDHQNFASKNNPNNNNSISKKKEFHILALSPSLALDEEEKRKMDEKMYALGNALAPVPEDKKDLEDNRQMQQERTPYQIQTPFAVFRQMLIPFVIAGFGSMFAGVILNAVTEWPVFDKIPQIAIMVSAFLGLIGNIETTLASRLSTQANLGRLDSWSTTRNIVFGNIMVVQCQASTVGLFAALCSLIVSTIRKETRDKINVDSILLLCSASVTTSIIANTLIATMIIMVILVTRRLHINPDNISTPVAASMGDVCTITILANVSQWLDDFSSGRILQIALIIFFIGLAPVFGYFARQNRWTKSVIYTGWTAILGAVIIEQPGGVVMESAFHQYKVLSTFQPLVNGIASNLVGIQTSRMSTFLHASAPKGQLPPTNPTYCVSPFFVFCSKDLHARMARLLMLVIVPAHLFYMAIIYLLQDRYNFSIIITFPFISVYTLAVLIQLSLLLYLAYVSVFWAWKKRINPDNSAIPFTSALADVLGNCLMALAFTYLKSINDANVSVLEQDDANLVVPLINATSVIV